MLFTTLGSDSSRWLPNSTGNRRLFRISIQLISGSFANKRLNVLLRAHNVWNTAVTELHSPYLDSHGLDRNMLRRKTHSSYSSTTVPKHENRLRSGIYLVMIRVHDSAYCPGCSHTMLVPTVVRRIRQSVPCQSRPTNKYSWFPKMYKWNVDEEDECLVKDQELSCSGSPQCCFGIPYQQRRDTDTEDQHHNDGAILDESHLAIPWRQFRASRFVSKASTRSSNSLSQLASRSATILSEFIQSAKWYTTCSILCSFLWSSFHGSQHLQSPVTEGQQRYLVGTNVPE